MSARVQIVILLASCSVAAAGAHAQAAPKNATQSAPTGKHAGASSAAQPEVGFLEYLGSLEGDDDNWTDVADQVLGDEGAKASPKSEAEARVAAEKK